MLCTIDLSAPRDLDFTLQIFGTATAAPEARFLIVASEYAIVCHCQTIEGGIRVHVPCLDGVIPPGIHRARFEVILGDKIYVPIEDEIELIAPIKIAASIAQPPVAQPTVSMKMAQSAPATVTTEGIKPLFTFAKVEEELKEEEEEEEVVAKQTIKPEKKPEKKHSTVDMDLMASLLKRKK